MSRPDVHTLQNETLYRKILELDFSEMTPFVLNHIGGKEKAAVIFMALNLATALFILIYIVWALTADQLDGGRVFWQILRYLFGEHPDHCPPRAPARPGIPASWHTAHPLRSRFPAIYFLCHSRPFSHIPE